MTREEARDQIVIFMADEHEVINDRDRQALEMAVKALEQELCEDCISREEALSDEGLGEFHYYEDYSKMRNYLKSLPSVQPRSDVDSFVDFLITENCEGCTECEPRLPGDKSFACCEEGRAKWLLEMAKKFKESEG